VAAAVVGVGNARVSKLCGDDHKNGNELAKQDNSPRATGAISQTSLTQSFSGDRTGYEKATLCAEISRSNIVRRP
jgi:hypothetical protein